MRKARKGESASVFIALLLLVSIARLSLISAQEVYDDPAVYAEMVREMAEAPSLVPHYLGNPVSWKPPVAFYLYALPAAVAWAIAPALEPVVALRIGPALASIACAFVLFAIGKKLYGARQGFVAGVVFLTANATLSIANLVLLDTALVLFILLALYAYIRSVEDEKWLAPAFAFSALAGLAKGYAGFMAPLLGIAYYWANGKNLRKPCFVASLLGAPLALIAYAVAFTLVVGDGGREIFSLYVYDAIGRIFVSGPGLLSNTTEFFRRSFPWLLVAPAGFALLELRKGGDRFLAVWTGISVLFLLGATGYWWYCLPIVPAVALLVGKAVGRMKGVHAFALVSACLLLSFANYGEVPTAAQGSRADQVATGKFLSSGCESTLLFTRSGVSAIPFYKFSGSECRDYSSLRQVVADPYAPMSYSAYRTIRELMFEHAEEDRIENPSSEYLRGLVRGYETAVLAKEFYETYELEPLPEYDAVFFSPNGEFAVLRRRAG